MYLVDEERGSRFAIVSIAFSYSTVKPDVGCHATVFVLLILLLALDSSVLFFMLQWESHDNKLNLEIMKTLNVSTVLSTNAIILSVPSLASLAWR